MRLFVIHDKMNELRMHEIRFNLSHNIKKAGEFLPVFICTVCLRSSFDSTKLCYLHISFGLSIWVWWNGWSFIVMDSTVVVGVNLRKVYLGFFLGEVFFISVANPTHSQTISVQRHDLITLKQSLLFWVHFVVSNFQFGNTYHRSNSTKFKVTTA